MSVSSLSARAGRSISSLAQRELRVRKGEREGASAEFTTHALRGFAYTVYLLYTCAERKT